MSPILLLQSIKSICRYTLLYHNRRKMSLIQNEIKEIRISIGELSIKLASTGSGSHPLLFMPGALGTGKTDFGPQLENFNSDNYFTLYAWDPPGYGESIPPARQWGIDIFQKDATVALESMKKIGVDKFSIAGWSDGGITGMILAGLYPKFVNKLVIWGANAYISEHDISMIEAVRNVESWSPRMKVPMENIYGVEKFPKLWNNWCNIYRNIYEQSNGDLCKNNLASITCPTLIIHGDKDVMISPEHPDYLLNNIKGSRLHRFTEGKHNLHFKYSKEFNKLVKDFLLE